MCKMDLAFILFISLIYSVSLASSKLTCIGDNGEPVDMFVLYKLPRIKTSGIPLVRTGYAYAYLDSNNQNFRLSKHSISDSLSSAGRTLNQVYNNKRKNEQAHVFYNDENPNGATYLTCGHTKGALAFNLDSGFWMINSVPKYPPPANESYQYPHSGSLYGQMFICVTFNSTSFHDIGRQLRYDDPHIHDANLPDDMAVQFQDMQLLLRGHMMRKPPYNRTAHLRSLGGRQFTHFGKGRHFNDDLYHGLVAPTLLSNLLTETWQHDRKRVIGPSCKQFTVEDVTYINVSMIKFGVDFKNAKDHAKFAIGKSASSPYVCIGDINRETSQYRRGGGTLCQKNPDLWKTFRSMIRGFNACH